jgi:Double-GTPase 2
MSPLDQIIYRAPGGTRGIVLQAAASFQDPGSGDLWLRRLESWLRAGGPLGRCYLSFGAQSALIRWHDNTTSGAAWQFAHAVVGPSAVLTGSYALLVRELPARLPSLPPDDRPLQVVDTDRVELSHPGAIGARARSKEAIELLVPLLACVLSGEQRVIMPWTEWSLPEAVIWGLVSILDMLGDTSPVSYLTYASGQAADIAGLFVSFRSGASAPPSDPDLEAAAIALATNYADNPAGLRQTLRQHGVPGQTDPIRRIELLLDMWPPRHRPAEGEPPTVPTMKPVNLHPDGKVPTTVAQSTSTNGGSPGRRVTCPICLTPIQDWDAQPRWQWDEARGAYTELNIPADITGPLRINLERGSAKRCPNPYQFNPKDHYLPADYGSFGPPVVLGFVGLTRSGKTHLLSAMIGAMRAGLRQYGVDYWALDRSLHNRFLDERVRPLLNESKVLHGTQEGIVTFADAFLMKLGKGQPRPVVLFDVAGGDLTVVTQTKKFLDIADGLFFIVDPTQIETAETGDQTFDNVLDLLRGAGRLPDQVSAAIVLNKADILRFEDPVTRWLRSGTGALNAEEFLSESRDVYAYLQKKGAAAWTLPYEECARATLHIASPAGGADLAEGNGSGVFPRGVTPRRVLRPLVAMLAMTGVLTGPEADKVGI